MREMSKFSSTTDKPRRPGRLRPGLRRAHAAQDTSAHRRRPGGRRAAGGAGGVTGLVQGAGEVRRDACEDGGDGGTAEPAARPSRGSQGGPC